MIAEVIPGAYDAEGRKVFRPFGTPPGPSAHISPRSLSHPLSIHCHSVEDDRQFLKTCKGVSDKEQFGRDDYWQPPERFEQIKKGDCDDFAFWDLAAGSWNWDLTRGSYLGVLDSIAAGTHGSNARDTGSHTSWHQLGRHAAHFSALNHSLVRTRVFGRLG